ncbi:MAG: FecR domain-containing protein, partial [Anaerolineales bacterium]|nr:FecR domain-containing protein [Anaerolineales bacterium]
MDRIRQWIQERSGFDWAVVAVLGPAVLILVFAFFSGLFSSSEPTTLETAAPEALVETTSDEEIAEVEPAVEPAAETEMESEVASNETAEPQEVAAASPLFDLYIPLFSSQSVPEAATAFLEDVQGLVEYQQFDGTWVQVAHGATVKPGYRIRTAAYSGATVRFRDGSAAEVAANSELSIDELNAQRPEEGFRTIVMTQWSGESEHHVAFRNDGGSRYEVKNPNGTGLARGTIFTVVVGPDQTAHYEVTEGRVDVTGVNVTVIVVAGQLTTIPAGEAPSEPAFMVSGEGEVTAMGEEWVIGGQTFKTDAETVIVGEPEIGDYVSVEGHLAENGDRIADTITLLPENEDERFSIRGEVSAIGDGSWTVSGTELTLSEDVLITGEIATGDTVDVSGIIGEEGELIAETITLVDEDAPGLPFTFVGVVQSIGDESWDISGRTVVISDVTTIDEGLAAADTVQV